MGFGRCSDPTTNDATLGSGKGSDCHTTSGSSQNFNPITVYATMGFGPNSDPFINHALGSGRRSNPTIDHAALGFGISSGCHATSGSNQNSDPITIIHAAASSDPNSNPVKALIAMLLRAPIKTLILLLSMLLRAPVQTLILLLAIL